MRIRFVSSLLLISCLLTGCMYDIDSESTSLFQTKASVQQTVEEVDSIESYTLDTVDEVEVGEVLLPLYLHANKAVRLRVPHCEVKHLDVTKKSSSVVLEQNAKYHYVRVLNVKDIKGVKKTLDFYDIKLSKQGSSRWFFSSVYENVVGIIQRMDKKTFVVYYTNKSSVDEDVDEEFYNVLVPVLLKRNEWKQQTTNMVVNVNCGVSFNSSVFDVKYLGEDTCTLYSGDTKVCITLYDSASVFANRDSCYDQLRRCCSNVSEVNGELRGTNEYNAYRCVVDDEVHIGFFIHASSTEEMSKSQQDELLSQLCEINVFREELKDE